MVTLSTMITSRHPSRLLMILLKPTEMQKLKLKKTPTNGEREKLQTLDQFIHTDYLKEEPFQMDILSTMITLRPPSKIPTTLPRLPDLQLLLHKRLPMPGERDQLQILDLFFH
jgi:hypothetical protein